MIAKPSADPDTNRLTGDSYQEYKCDNCGHPQEGYAKVVAVNEQEAISELQTPPPQAAQQPQRQHKNQHKSYQNRYVQN